MTSSPDPLENGAAEDLLSAAASLEWLETLYLHHLRGDRPVPEAWRAAFEELAREEDGDARRLPDEVLRPRASVPAGADVRGHVSGWDRVRSDGRPPPDGGESARLAALQDRVDQLVRAFRVRGHCLAALDPLDRPRPVPDELEPAFYGFTGGDLDRRFSCDTLPEPHERTLREILDHLRETYARSIGVQFMHIHDGEVRRWLIDRMEATRNHTELPARDQRRILRLLTQAIAWETFVRRKFVGAKSFSLEGSETLLPLLDLVFQGAAGQGVRDVVLAMAHRGRLNVMVNLLRKPAREVLASFLDVCPIPHDCGDVRYHLGTQAALPTETGGPLNVSLCFNPSHLEWVDAVALGRTRARQDGMGDGRREQAMAVIVHGDAAFMGQGVAFEALNLSELAAYHTGGSLHVVLNNQIGFTTPPEEGRSSPYAADVARFLQVPLFHVNGEDPEAVAQVVGLALAFRQRFRRDVVIDMYGLRRLGHNEIDEPAITQPVMARLVRERESVRDRYLRRLARMGEIDEREAESIEEAERDRLKAELAAARAIGEDDGGGERDEGENGGGSGEREGGESGRGAEGERRAEGEGHDAGGEDAASGESDDDAEPAREGDEAAAPGTASPWDGYHGGPAGSVPEPDTGLPRELLAERLEALARVPDGFDVHRIVRRMLEGRVAMAAGERPLDWGAAEALAFASLAAEGIAVRLSGQDSERGTFGHRHAALRDQETGEAWRPLEHVAQGQAPVEILNSPLSEAAVLGFEYGYSLDAPGALVLWEAQFGDFVNAAQVVIDQFLASAEEKWRRLSGLVLLLPHGAEGQGPEHSSARLERFLSLCAADNLQVAMPSMPAQFFHLLRRQALWRWRKPLVVFTPKSLLRSPRCTSSLDELAEGSFRPVLPDPRRGAEARASRVVLCSGKLFHELDGQRDERGLDDVALVRLEQLHPFPHRELDEVLRWVDDDVPVVWAQEEPANMGAWRWLRSLCPGRLLGHHRLFGVSRPPAASPAGGSSGAHAREQEELWELALSEPLPDPDDGGPFTGILSRPHGPCGDGPEERADARAGDDDPDSDADPDEDAGRGRDDDSGGEGPDSDDGPDNDDGSDGGAGRGRDADPDDGADPDEASSSRSSS